MQEEASEREGGSINLRAMLPNRTSNMLADRIPTRTTTAWASNLSVGHWARHADKSVNSRDRTVTSRSGLVPRLPTTPRTSSLRRRRGRT